MDQACAIFFLNVSVTFTFVHLNGFNVTITAHDFFFGLSLYNYDHGVDFGYGFVTMLSRSSHGAYRASVLYTTVTNVHTVH